MTLRKSEVSEGIWTRIITNISKDKKVLEEANEVFITFDVARIYNSSEGRVLFNSTRKIGG